MRLFTTVALALLVVAPPAMADVLGSITESKTIRIGYRTDVPPFSFQSKTGDAAGYSVDICRAIAVAVDKQLNLDVFGISYVPVTADNRFKMLEEGKIDILCGPTTATLARREIVDFSMPIFVDGAGIMVGPGLTISRMSDLAKLRLGVRSGTTTEQVLNASFKNADITTFKDHGDGVAGLKAGTLDAYFADRTLLEYPRHVDGKDSKLRVADEYLTVEPYALAIPKEDSDFRLPVDRTISRLYRSKQIMEIAGRAFGSAKMGNLVKALYRIAPLPE
jgi:polar amino acid transport system substrate-binding protein/glutamate/aspartate transport system substrate-binding protein